MITVNNINNAFCECECECEYFVIVKSFEVIQLYLLSIVGHVWDLAEFSVHDSLKESLGYGYNRLFGLPLFGQL